MCKIKLIKNSPVIVPRIIFCVRCDLLPPQCSHSHLQSRAIRYHDSINIAPENTNSHGSIQCGSKWKCAASGATSPIIANTIGMPQQKICGKIVATIPSFTALFFMFVLFLLWYRCMWSVSLCKNSWHPHQGSNLDLILRRNLFYPVELWGHYNCVILFISK